MSKSIIYRNVKSEVEYLSSFSSVIKKVKKDTLGRSEVLGTEEHQKIYVAPSENITENKNEYEDFKEISSDSCSDCSTDEENNFKKCDRYILILKIKTFCNKITE